MIARVVARSRRRLALAGGLAALALLAACGRGEVALMPSVAETVTLRIATFEGPETSALFRIIPEWEHITGHRVELGIIDPAGGPDRRAATSYVEYRDAIMANAQELAGRYDLIIVDDPWMPYLAGNGRLAPLSPFGYERDPDIVERSASLGVWPPAFGPLPPDAATAARGSETYAVPLVGNVMMLWYRADVIRAAGSLEEFGEVLRDPDPAYVGSAGMAPSNNPHGYLTWLASRGGDIFDRDWRPRPLRTSLAIDAMTEYLRESTRLGVPFEEYRHERFSPHVRVLDGTASASIAWAADAQQILTSSVSDQIRVTRFPEGRRGSALTGNWLLAIPVDAAHPEAAFDFLTWATSAEIMKTSALLGVPPVRHSLFADRELNARYPWLRDVEVALASAFARPRVPAWDVVEGALGCALDRGLQRVEGLDPENPEHLEVYAETAREVLLAAADDIEATMEAWGYYRGSQYWVERPTERIPGDPRMEWTCDAAVAS